jgi:hypothetical protein
MRSSSHIRLSTPNPRRASDPGTHRTDPHGPDAPPSGIPASWQDAWATAQGVLDNDLLALLEQHAQGAGDTLDLSEHRTALRRAEHRAGGALAQTMAALAERCAVQGHPVRSLVLPSGLKALPGWLPLVGMAALRVPGFQGRELQAQGLPGLRWLDLGDMAPRALKLQLPMDCELLVHLPDGRPPALSREARGTHHVVRLKWRPLNFNHRVPRPDKANEVYVCRHLALEKLRLWGRPAFLERLPEDPMASRAGIERTLTPDADALYADLQDRACETHLVAMAQWAPFVEARFQQMAAEGRTTQVALFGTESHAMALRFDASDPEGPSVECWDPNFTDVSTFSRAPFDFQRLFWDVEKVRDVYFRESKPFGVPPLVRVTPIEDPLYPERSVARTPAERQLHLAFAGLPHTWHPHVVHTLVSHGFEPPGLEGLADHIEHAALTPSQCRALLTAHDGHNYPALHPAATHGHGQAFGMMVDPLERAFRKGLLTRQDVLAVLHAQAPLGTAMTEAFVHGRKGVIAAIGSAALRLVRLGVLEPRQVYHLMRAPNASGATSIAQIKDLRCARQLQRTLAKLRKEGALDREDGDELLAEVREAKADLRDQAKQARRAAKAQPAGLLIRG